MQALACAGYWASLKGRTPYARIADTTCTGSVVSPGYNR